MLRAALVNPVRPTFPPTTAPAVNAPDAGRTAAQKAFFDLAMGKAAPAAAPAPVMTTQTAAPVPAPQRTAVATGEAPTRILRPGSLLDIRI